MAAQPSQTLTVVLRSTDGLDAYDKRTLSLRPGSRIIIGRASKNPQKTGLMTSASNAFLDSPVVSREHAIITAESESAVYILDNASMHGTLLNGLKLQPQQPVKLNSGDMLQFGQDVSREKDHFQAQKFTFQAALLNAITSTSTSAPTSFSRGFTVPDVDTSEDEDEDADADADDKMNRPAYGSQMHPVSIADDDPEESDIDMEEEATIIQQPTPALSSLLSEGRATSQLDGASSVIDEPRSIDSNSDEEDTRWRHFEDEDDRHPIDEYDPIEDEELDGYPRYNSYGDSCNESDVPSNNSVADSDSQDEDEDDDEEGYTDMERSTDLESNTILESSTALESNTALERKFVTDSVVELDRSNDDARRMKLKTMLLHQANTSTPQPEPFTAEPTLEPAKQDTAVLQKSSGRPNLETALDNSAPPPLYGANVPHHYGFQQTQPPPRFRAEPAWTSVDEYVSPYMPCSNSVTGTNNFAPASYSPWASAGGNNPYNPTGTCLFKPYSAQPSQLLDYGLTVKHPADRDAEQPAQPTRRTKVSIPEIVENVVQQPPTQTPESGSSSDSAKLKRKADVLDEEVAISTPQEVAEVAANAAPEVVNAAPETSSVAVPNRRPKKRLRKALGGAVKTVAGLLLPGTAIAVGILTQLPNEFWTS